MEFKKPDYTYKVKEVVKIVDGDTVDVIVSLGFNLTALKRVRFLHVDTDELRGGTTETKQRAKAAKLRVEELLKSGSVYLRTKMDSTGKYGRVLGEFFVVRTVIQESGESTVIINVNQTLIDEGFSKGETNTKTVTEWIKKLFS